jgi:hypothetical protein
MSHHFAPGARVEIHDDEWRIKHVDMTSDSGHLLTCKGLSELVRGREVTFLSRLETSIRVYFPVIRRHEADTLPGGPFETTIEYVAPLFKPDREADYCRAWAFFARETI